MANNYTVGPFGRLLPIPEGSGSGHQLESRIIPVASPMPHSTIQLPPPKRSSPLHFGSDLNLPSNAQPVNYNHRPQWFESKESDPPPMRGPLPSVSQLLTPGSLASLPASPYSPRHHANSPPAERPIRPPSAQGPLDAFQARSGPYRLQFTPPPPTPFQAFESNPQLSRSSSGINRSVYPNHSYNRPWQSSESQSYQGDEARYSTQQQTIPYHQGQIPHQSVSLNGTAQSPTFQTEYESQPGSFGGQRTLRVVSEKHIPGEGLCYIYDDGTHCRKVIDGETVNASWGVTKAGKPRKRLAQACITCREKKIKCDPSVPKCVQCQKFGRECRFENAPRGNQASPPTPYQHHASRLAYSEDVSTSMFIQRLPILPSETVNGPQSTGDQAPSRSAGYLGHILHPSPPKARSFEGSDEESMSVKRRRMRSSSVSESTLASTSKGKELPPHQDLEPTIMTVEGAIKTIDHRTTNSQTDPYILDPDLTLRYMDLYFTHINAATYKMFPRAPFIEWLRNTGDKSADDTMVIYSMLAIASIFAPDDDKTHSKLFCNIARQALEKNVGRFNLQLVQSRLITALLHFALGESTKAWDYCGSAIRAACALNFNTEDGVDDLADDQIPEYGLSKTALAECQRRTFWSVFLMDRFSGFCTGHLSVIQNRDIFLRLPCPEDIYELNSGSVTPFFPNEYLDPGQSSTERLGSMAYLARISSAWGDVLGNIYRIRHHRQDTYQTEYETFYRRMVSQLNDWMASLPEHLVCSEANIDRGIREGYIGTLMSLHTLHQTTHMKLNRHVRHDLLSQRSIHRNITAARSHALDLLQITSALVKVDRERRLPVSVDLKVAFSTPFTGYAILSATEILTAAGRMHSIPEDLSLIKSGLSVVEELAEFWASARGQRKAIQRRLEEIGEMALRQVGKVAYRVTMPMESTFGIENDIFYAMGSKETLQAIGIRGIPEEKVSAVRAM